MDISRLLRSISMDRSKKRIVRFMILSMGIGMIAYGVFRGEVAIVLNKAINICIECIGLG